MFAFDLEFLRWLEGMRTGLLNGLFEGITMLGEETLIILLVVALWFAVDKKLAQQVFFVTVASLGVNGVVKNFAQIPRPFTKGISCVRVDTATGYSFPSGHTQGFATWSSFFAFKFKKLWLSILVGILVVLVGWLRKQNNCLESYLSKKQNDFVRNIAKMTMKKHKSEKFSKKIIIHIEKNKKCDIMKV